jgi:hypothetical protein
MDYKDAEECDVLFLSDSLQYDPVTCISNSFSNEGLKLILASLKRFTGLKVEFQAAVKCPTVKEADIDSPSKDICRVHMQESIRKCKPRLIFACGNLAMVMLLKKSGIMDKRGTRFIYELDGIRYNVIPLLHPTQVIVEPRFAEIFYLDVLNGVNRYIYNREVSDLTYVVVASKEQADKFKFLETTKEPISCDTETSGLDFKKDVVHTIAITHDKLTIVTPLDHKDSYLEDREYVLDFLRRVLQNPNNRKAFVNGKFDLKMVRRYGIIPTNIWDIKTMFHLIQEDAPKSLKELTKRFIPETLEDL